MVLTVNHLAKIERDFAAADFPRVKSELERLSLSYTWESAHNWNNTICAALDLSQGDLEELRFLVEAAMLDFRDVIYWWTLKQANTS